MNLAHDLAACRTSRFFAIPACLILCSIVALGQTPGASPDTTTPGTTSGSSSSTAPVISRDAQDRIGSDSDSTFLPQLRRRGTTGRTQQVLTTDQIVEILQSHPEQMPTAKQLVLTRLKAQGVSTDTDLTPDDIYDAIDSDPELRASLTQLLTAPSATAARSMGALGPDAGTNPLSDGLDGEMLGADSLPRRSIGEERGRGDYATGLRTRDTFPRAAPEPKATLQRPNPYFGLQSLRDLYAQLNPQEKPLRRFGLDFFRQQTRQGFSGPGLDMAAGPDHVLVAGDALTLVLSGGISERMGVTVDSTGRILLPEAGMTEVAGKTIADAQSSIEHVLTPYFRNVHADLSLSRLGTMRIYVVGDVVRPGAYDVSSLSTALNALYMAGGPTESGSLRSVKQYRGKRLVSEIDFYDFLLKGIRADVERLQAGDTILVPPVGDQVTVAGVVRRPAIYEVKSERDLGAALELAGGVLSSATLQNVKVERTQAHERRAMVNVDLPQGSTIADLRKVLGTLGIQDGDRLTISPILPHTEQVIYIQGHVARPGKYPFHKGMEIGELLKSYNDVLPEPADHAEIVRLEPPDDRPRVIDFNLKEVLDQTDPIVLQPLDTIRIFGRYEIDSPKVTINGEVLRPGDYPLAEGMTVAALVRMAGGFKRSAMTRTADVASYVVENGVKVRTKHTEVEIDRALAGEKAKDIVLSPGDVVSIRQLAGWGDIGGSIMISGEIRYPGSYGIEEGERLSSVLRRAGGFRDDAYPEGAMLERIEVKDLAEKSRDELIHRIESEGPSMKLVSGMSGQEQAAVVQVMLQQQQQALSTLRQQPATGRLVIKISSNIAEWENTAADIELRPGDTLLVPKRPNFVLVNGQVYSPSAINFTPGKSVEWYLRQAGGPTEFANHANIFVIRANGSVFAGGGGRGFWKEGVLGAVVKAGDTIVVPEKITAGSMVWKNLLNTAQFTSSLALAARVVTSF